jgi:3beta-hydroxy-delta5-steroid dehydrogenase/steroid delta-isomerase
MADEMAPERRPLDVPLPAAAGWEADDSCETTELGHCLVTGGAGFLGRHLAHELVHRGHRVRVFDYQPIDYSHERLDFVQGDIREFEDVRKACEGIDTVFHTAAMLEFLGFSTRAQRVETFAVNVRGVQHVVRACREAGVARLIHTSSNNVTFDGPVIDGDESLPYVAHPKDLYTRTKILGEKTALEANGEDGLLTCAIRPGGIYGPGEKLVFPRVVEECASGKYVSVIGDGTALSDNTFIDNLVDGEIEAARHLVPGSPLGGQAYYITDGAPINCFDFFRPIVQGLGFEHPKRRIPAGPLLAFVTVWEFLHAKLGIPRPVLTPMEVRKIVVSHYNRIDKARRDFGWVPKVSTEDAMARCLEHCKELLAEHEAVDRPHWGWWVSILGGMTLLGVLTLSPDAHALWSRSVTSWTPRWLLAAVFVWAVLTHVYKGMKAVRIAERAGLEKTSMGWGWQTFALGFASLRMLARRIEKQATEATGRG